MNDILSSSPQLTDATPSTALPFSFINAVSAGPTDIKLPPLKEIVTHHMAVTEDRLPRFLEPTPTLENVGDMRKFVPRMFSVLNSKEEPNLVPSSASSCTSDASIPLTPLGNTINANNIGSRCTCPYSSSFLTPSGFLPTIQPRFRLNNESLKCPYRSTNKSCSNENPVGEPGQPFSPTMIAASATAATAASASHAADTFLNSISLRPDDHPRPEYTTAVTSMLSESEQASYARVSFMVHGSNRAYSASNRVDRQMFLTKNAHIKRPRNAWIHFRCHYGQALKRQDPTLRAEEISKRASRRWALISEKEKKPWLDLAEQEKQAHKAAFPEYRYCPRRSNAALLARRKSSMDTLNSSSKSNMLYDDNINDYDNGEKIGKRRLMD